MGNGVASVIKRLTFCLMAFCLMHKGPPIKDARTKLQKNWPSCPLWLNWPPTPMK